MNFSSDRFLRVVLPILTGAGLIGLWYAIKALFGLHDLILPAPHQVLQAFASESASLTKATQTTFVGASLGFFAAVTAGLAVSLLMVSFRYLRYSLYPFIILMQMMPLIATAAIIVIIFDVGVPSVVLIAFLIGFFPVVASTLQGLRSVPEGHLELFRLYRAEPWQELFLLRLPYSLPYFFTGAKIAATLAVIGSVTGEIFAGSTDGSGGLGFMIIVFKSELKISAIYAATIICCLMGFVFVSFVLFFKWLCLHHWHESQMISE
jgi:NitT/TauT family transport system permease protein